MVGILAWKCMDNNGKEHKLSTPKCLYVKGGNVRLLSPQNWARNPKYMKPTQGKLSETDTRKATLLWKQRKKVNYYTQK